MTNYRFWTSPLPNNDINTFIQVNGILCNDFCLLYDQATSHNILTMCRSFHNPKENLTIFNGYVFRQLR